jgi:hypothetical protein
MRSGPSALQGSVRLAQSAYSLIRTAHSTHIFAVLDFASQALIRAGKMSQTAGTLCAIRPKFFEKILAGIDKNIRGIFSEVRK